MALLTRFPPIVRLVIACALLLGVTAFFANNRNDSSKQSQASFRSNIPNCVPATTGPPSPPPLSKEQIPVANSRVERPTKVVAPPSEATEAAKPISSPPSRSAIAAPPPPAPRISQVETGNVERLPAMLGPRPAPLSAKLALIAVAVGSKGKPFVDRMIQQFGVEHFSFVLFVYDGSDYSEFEWHSDVLIVHAKGQMKWWFAKRFLHPDIVSNYDYIFVWDDDLDVSDMSVMQLVHIMQRFRIDIAQPALVGEVGGHWPEVLPQRNTTYGRWTNFAEVMAPVFSRRAWRTCVYDLLQFDLSSGYGVDAVMQQFCAGRGVCRQAVIDPAPVNHVSGRSSGVDASRGMTEAQQLVNRLVPECPNGCWQRAINVRDIIEDDEGEEKCVYQELVKEQLREQKEAEAKAAVAAAKAQTASDEAQQLDGQYNQEMQSHP
eukprot:TRINITY_DN1760_c0_g1_i1.p1 TRINITY_DN1760_c0_g1~~TRINITY_DN1760_c0_g1_i1.p1  ORF type:complete len:433 (-),score=87.27 TRINITY_DN1760_c0_g1_i1:716-2014(-)